MIKWSSLRISLTALTLWLCIGSLIVLPIMSEDGSRASMFSIIDFENYDPSYQTETDDDLFALLITGLGMAGLFFSKSWMRDLSFQSAFLSPESPPPK
jgi:hypothetical protein